MARFDYDLFVIGGGSGGVRAARVAASLGKRVAIAEADRFGGTCVIRGCVPKKLLVYASQFSSEFADSAAYGWSIGSEPRFDWVSLIAHKDREIERLETIYRAGIEKAGGEIFAARAELLDEHTISLNGERKVSAETILLATGGRANPHAALPGHELCITSNEAFQLAELPKRIIIAGGGYIAVEFANIFHGLGVETTLLYRGVEILGGFDQDLREGLHAAMAEKGIDIRCHTVFAGVERLPSGDLQASLSTGEMLQADQIMLALGRMPNTQSLGLEVAGVLTDAATGAIIVDEWSRTSVPHIFAIGDVTNRVQLTPVAIHEAMCFVDTVFRCKPARPDYEAIPTAVFSQPEIGTVGLSEEAASRQHAELEIYRTTFRPMRTAFAGRNDRMMMKLVVESAGRRVVGAHILGPGAGELAQLIGVAVKGKLTKDVFDATMAVHPTAAEELVTMYRPTYRVRDGERIAA